MAAYARSQDGKKFAITRARSKDADVVMFLYRDEIYNPETADKGVAEVIVSKHRNGPTGSIELWFKKSQTRFVSYAGERFAAESALASSIR